MTLAVMLQRDCAAFFIRMGCVPRRLNHRIWR